MRIKAQRIRDAGASRRFNKNSILIMENLDSGGCETLETPNMFIFPSVLSLITIFIWSCFILERFILQVKVEVALLNFESVFCQENRSFYLFLENICFRFGVDLLMICS